MYTEQAGIGDTGCQNDYWTHPVKSNEFDTSTRLLE